MTPRLNKAMAIIAAILAVGIIAIGCWIVFVENAPKQPESTSEPTSLIQSARNTALNAALDASGIKTRLQDTLLSHADNIAAVTGMTESQVTEAISDLDIQDWKATTLPSSAQKQNTVETSINGVDTQITTYDNPSYVTVNAYGQDITMSVPSGAQQYTDYLAYLEN